jgi:phosphoenolpyruvate-protein kinase (PTS system EI component)
VQGVQLHHAAQIARECGVPYVDLPQELWESVPDGARLVVDGKEGIVMVLNE